MKYDIKIPAGLFSVFTFLFFLLCIENLYAQNSTSSPYSRFGIGELSSTSFARNLAMGGTEIGLNQPLYINYGNPAALSSLWYTTFESAVNFTQYELQTSSSIHHTQNSSLSYFEFAFPVKPNKMALSFGLIPYSKVGYSVTEQRTSPFGDPEIRTYDGSGGINNFHIGSGYKLSKKISIGLDAEYLFGELNNDRTIYFLSPYYYNTSEHTSTSIGWFHFKAGMQFTFDSLKISKSDSIILFDKKISLAQGLLESIIEKNKGDTSKESYAQKNQLAQEIASYKLMKKNVVNRKVKSDWRLVLGIVGSPQVDLHANNSELDNTFRYRYFGSPDLGLNVRDTIVNTEGEKGYVRLPFSAGAGFSLAKGSRWMLCGDYRYQQWSKFSIMGEPDSLVNSWKISTGIQFTPNDRANNYWKKVQYRLGFHYEKGYLQFSGHTINDIGISGGFTLPIVRRVGEKVLSNTGTVLHFTVEAGHSGTTLDNLILERYVRFTFGFTINDRWFVKSKYD